MKKLFLILFLVLLILGSIFTYILYSEGAFDTREDVPKSNLKPFVMKCEAGKCGAGKCGEAE